MTTYEGWSTHETWQVNLWLSNDEPTYRYTLYRAAIANTVDELANELEAMLEPPQLSGVFADLMASALAAVDWHELAEHWFNQARENG